MSLILAGRLRWMSEHGIVLPSDLDPPGAITDLSVTSWDGFPPTQVVLTWTVPADLPSGDPLTYEVRAFACDDGDVLDWPGWDHATILAIDQAYAGGAGTTEVATLTIGSPYPRNGYLFCVRSLDADFNVSVDSNLASKYEWHTGYSLPLVMYGG
jgi:hypothetical protein